MQSVGPVAPEAALAGARFSRDALEFVRGPAAKTFLQFGECLGTRPLKSTVEIRVFLQEVSDKTRLFFDGRVGPDSECFGSMWASRLQLLIVWIQWISSSWVCM